MLRVSTQSSKRTVIDVKDAAQYFNQGVFPWSIIKDNIINPRDKIAKIAHISTYLFRFLIVSENDIIELSVINIHRAENIKISTLR